MSEEAVAIVRAALDNVRGQHPSSTDYIADRTARNIEAVLDRIAALEAENERLEGFMDELVDLRVFAAKAKAENERLQEQNRQLGKDLPAMHADLQRLLKTLGLRHGARPESPHVCMTEAIEAVEALMRDGARFQTAHYLGSDGRPRHEHIDLAPSETTKEQE